MKRIARSRSMKHRSAGLATTLVLSGGLGLAGLGLGGGVAQATPGPVPNGTWCPGQGQPLPAAVQETQWVDWDICQNYWCPGEKLPFADLAWDMSVCHVFHTVPVGHGNVNSFTWADSPPPPPPPPPPSPPPPPGPCNLFQGCPWKWTGTEWIHR